MLYLLEQEVSCHYIRRDRPGGKVPKATNRAKGIVWSTSWALLTIERVTKGKLIYGVGAEP